MTPKPVVVVVGASRGLGLAVVSILLSSAEATVVAISRKGSPELDNLASAHGDALVGIQCDATDTPALMETIGSLAEEFGRLDALILNQGTLTPIARLEDPKNLPVFWTAHFETNVFSCVAAVQAAIPALRRSPNGGRVIFVSSGAAVGGIAGWGAYNASKAAVNSICRTLATEEKSIISVAFRPGKVDTAMQAELRSGGAGHMDAAVHESFIREYEDGKLLPPDVPGHVIAKLALHATADLSGKFLSWDSDECKPYLKPS